MLDHIPHARRLMSLPRFALALLVTLVLAVPASAATVGSTALAAPGPCSGPAPRALYVAAGYAVPGAGVISSFGFRTSAPNAGQFLDFKVLRATGATREYRVIGQSGVTALLADGSVQTVPVAPIAVQAGDVLGFHLASTQVNGCYDMTRGATMERGFPNPSPEVGTTFTIAEPFPGYALNVSAEFTPAATPALTRSPTSLTFASRDADDEGASAAQSSTVTNPGTVPVTLTDVALSGDATEFARQTGGAGDCTTGTLLGAGESCGVRVVFDPTSPGPKSATVTVRSNAPDIAIALDGTGTRVDTDGDGTATTPTPTTTTTASPMRPMRSRWMPASRSTPTATARATTPTPTTTTTRFADATDAFPLDAAESVDTDGDGTATTPTPTTTATASPDATDAFPLDASESVDTDGDGTGQQRRYRRRRRRRAGYDRRVPAECHGVRRHRRRRDRQQRRHR